MSTRDDGESADPGVAAERAEPVPLPMRKIAALWDWLPAFRAVAETENLRRAATFLALSPPALSRTLKLLEDHLGTALFLREGRSLRLTEAGRRLLVAVRSAMRAVDDALSPTERALRIHTLPALAPLIARGLESAVPLALSTRRTSAEDLLDALTRGALDLVVTTGPSAMTWPLEPAVATAALGDIAIATYGEARPGPHRVSLGDAWPFACVEAVALEVDDVFSAVEATRRGLVATLPCALAPTGVAASSKSSLPLWVIHRKAVGDGFVGPVAEAIDHLRQHFQAES